MPVLNAERYIERCLSSALGCGIPELEILVQDGGSVDATLTLAANVDDPRIHIASEPDAGQADALNRALRRARGDWILWLNADDEIAPGSVRAVLGVADLGVAAIVGDHAHINEANEVIKRYRVGPLSANALLRHGTCAFSGSLIVATDLARTIGFDSHLTFCMDFDFMLRLAAHTAITHVPVEVGRFRRQPASKTEVAPWGMYREHFAVARRAGAYRPSKLLSTVRLHFEMAAYILARPLWRSSLWMRLRPTKDIRLALEECNDTG